MGANLSGGSPREGVRSQLVGGATTGGGGPQAPPTRNPEPGTIAFDTTRLSA
jgi:hypothetical protein